MNITLLQKLTVFLSHTLQELFPATIFTGLASCLSIQLTLSFPEALAKTRSSPNLFTHSDLISLQQNNYFPFIHTNFRDFCFVCLFLQIYTQTLSQLQNEREESLLVWFFSLFCLLVFGFVLLKREVKKTTKKSQTNV